MEQDELEAEMRRLLELTEGESEDRHEFWMRLRQVLDGLRAFGMPAPDDLLRLEQELEAEFAEEMGEGAPATG